MAAPEEMPSIELKPSDSMASLFRRTVMAVFGKKPVDGSIKVYIDPYGFSANQETIEPGPTPGQRIAIDRWVTLGTDGELTRHQESEPLNQRLAREIRSSDREPSEFERDFQTFRSWGYSEPEATTLAIDLLFTRPGISEACERLVAHLDQLSTEKALGLHDVDAFELADTIQRVRDNFDLPPA